MIRLLLTLLIFLYCSPVYALDMESFRSIPIAHEGRIKPMDSFARATLKNLSGRESLEKESAALFLAETIFRPGESIGKAIFKIDEADLRHRLGLSERKNFLYSLEEISPGLRETSPAVAALMRKEKKEFTTTESALLDIHEKALAYTALLRSLSLLLPLNIDLPEEYGIRQNKTMSFLELKKLEQNLSADLRSIVRDKGEDFDDYTEDQKRVAVATYQLEVIATGASGNDVFKIIPPQWQSDHGDWHAPWELLQSGEGSPGTAKLLEAWKAMGNAYNQGKAEEWRSVSAIAFEETLSQADEISAGKLKLEIFQNDFPPVLIGLIFYALSFAALLAFLAFENCKRLFAG